MADLTENLIYLVVSFFALVIIGFIYMIVINGAVTPLLTNIVNSPNVIQMNDSIKNDVLGGFTQVNIMLKILIPGLFLACFIAVILYIFFRREEENV